MGLSLDQSLLDHGLLDQGLGMALLK